MEENNINSQPPQGEAAAPAQGPASNNKFYILILILVLVIVGLVGYIGLSASSERKISQPSITMPPTQSTPISIEDLSPSPTGFENLQMNSNVYRLELRLKPGATLPLGGEKTYTLGDYLLEVLKLPKTEKYTDILSVGYDTTSVKGYVNEFKNNNDFYIVLKKGQLIDNNTYEDNYSTIRVVKESPDTEPYLSNSDYCQTDKDCLIRQDFCTYGSFNKYHNFADVWGCGPPADETGYTFGVCDESKKCITDVKFGGSKCIVNKCEAQNKEIVCKESCSERTDP